MFRIPGWERRTDQRFPAELETTCVVVGDEADDQPWPAQLEDISAHGLSLIVKRRFERRTCLSLQLENKAAKYRRTVLVQVMRVGRHRAGWRHGCAITGQFDADELKTFQSNNNHAAERAWVRLPSTARTHCFFLEADNGATCRTEVVNVSPAGAALLVSRPVPKGELVSIQVPYAENRVHRILAHVLHVTPQGNDQWLLGCSFLGELSDRELQAFLD